MDPSIERDAQILAAQSHALEETSPNVNTPILRLTPALRRRIYMDPWMGILVRLPSWHDEKYAVLNLNGGNYEPSHYHYNPAYKLGIYGLLVCCRTIYAEVSALLYSSNRFVIRYWEKQSLSPLRALTPSSLSSLTNLKIVLNQASCHFRDFRYAEDPQGVCCVDKNTSRPELHDAPLDLREARAKPLVDEWKSAAEHLARHISPHKLELCVVCDVRQDDLESATKVLEPLSLFSELHNCHIRLSRNPSPQLQRIAHDMVLKSRGLLLPDELEKTSQTKPRIGSHLLALPRELRLYILSYTDLITPWKEVEWSRDCNGDGKYIALYPRCRAVEGLHCDSHLHYGCRFFNCWPAHSLLSKAGIGCFCQVRHSAASSTCICWAPPIALFLVSCSSKISTCYYCGINRPWAFSFEERANPRHYRLTARCSMMRKSSFSPETALLYMTSESSIPGARLAIPGAGLLTPHVKRPGMMEKAGLRSRGPEPSSTTQINLQRASSCGTKSRRICSENYGS
jgi:hypothetical protein